MTDANCMTVVTDPANHAMQYSYDTENNLPFDPLITKTKLGALLFAYFAKGGYRTADGERFSSSLTQNAYSYDAASNRQSLTAPDGSITTYGYDTLNRLNGLANSWAGSFGFGYDALSRRTSLTRPNGVNTSYSYDSVSHLLSVLHQTSSTALDGVSYTYDSAGNRTSKTNYLNSVTSNYSYDPLYQLTQVTQGASTTESYTYDPVGNRLSSFGVPSYSYNSSNELTSNSSGSYSYDANGDTLSDASGKSYSWDFENRLTQAVNPGVGTTTFRYDPFGRRVQKAGPLGTTNYVYDDNSLIEELDGSGNALARYTQTLSIDDPLAELRSGTTTYYQADGTKSITSLTDPASAIVGTYAYDAFGNLSASTGSLTNPFRYTGRELDSETGLYNYRTRYYDSGIGRFTSEDLVRFKGGVNFYPYVRNRPVTFADPMGTCLWQFDSVTTTLGQCKNQPNKGLQCECLCEPIGINHQECVDDCKKGCLSPKLDPVEACSCFCDKRHENGSLNWVEWKLCKHFCKAGGK